MAASPLHQVRSDGPETSSHPRSSERRGGTTTGTFAGIVRATLLSPSPHLAIVFIFYLFILFYPLTPIFSPLISEMFFRVTADFRVAHTAGAILEDTDACEATFLQHLSDGNSAALRHLSRIATPLSTACSGFPERLENRIDDEVSDAILSLFLLFLSPPFHFSPSFPRLHSLRRKRKQDVDLRSHRPTFPNQAAQPHDER